MRRGGQTDRERSDGQKPARTSTAHTQLAPSANKPQPSLFPASERRPARGAPAKFQGGAVLLPTSSSFIPACRCPLRMGEHTTAPPLPAPETAVSSSHPIKFFTAPSLVGGSVLVPPTHEDFLSQASAGRRHVNPLLFQPWSNRLPSLHALPPSPAPIITKGHLQAALALHFLSTAGLSAVSHWETREGLSVPLKHAHMHTAPTVVDDLCLLL